MPLAAEQQQFPSSRFQLMMNVAAQLMQRWKAIINNIQMLFSSCHRRRPAPSLTAAQMMPCLLLLHPSIRPCMSRWLDSIRLLLAKVYMHTHTHTHTRMYRPFRSCDLAISCCCCCCCCWVWAASQEYCYLYPPPSMATTTTAISSSSSSSCLWIHCAVYHSRLIL